MDAPLLQPAIVRQFGNMQVQKPPVSDGSNDFLAGSFVKLSSGNLAACATDDVVCYGWCPDKSHAPTDMPPEALYGENHWPFSPDDNAEFEINITSGAGTFGQANSAPQRSAVSIGSSYGILRMTSGVHNGKQFLAADDTTNTLFTVVGWVDGVNGAADTYNPRVRVKVIKSKIQG